ncbi:MAG: hypothetical protein ACYDA9_01965 [Terriglobia bacterium]
MNQAFIFQGSETVGMMAFMGTCFALLVAAVMMVYVLAAQKIQFSKVVVLFTVVGIGLYLATLFGFSLTGRDIVLGLHGSHLP